MPIVKPNELDFSDKKIRMIISGYSGIGKSTLALSAPKPLLIDIENGINRVRPQHRKDTLIVNSYENLVQDLMTSDLKDYETLVVDTGGKLLDLMKPFVIRENPKNGQNDGSLTMKGWGAVGQKFKSFCDLVDKLGKHIIFIFHTKEEQDGDNVKLRIAMEGGAKNKIWEDMDLGGFVEMKGTKRTIGFSNCERYYAKATHGVSGIYEIPELTEGVENDFLTKMFDKVIADLQADAQKFNAEKDIYENAMQLSIFIKNAQTEEDLNNVLKNVLEAKHALTSMKELKTKINNKSKELGLTYDTQTKSFTKADF